MWQQVRTIKKTESDTKDTVKHRNFWYLAKLRLLLTQFTDLPRERLIKHEDLITAKNEGAMNNQGTRCLCRQAA